MEAFKVTFGHSSAISQGFKEIRHCGTSGIQRLSFMYDNESVFTAGAVRNVDFDAIDIDGDACIAYSSDTQGVCNVKRHDLAAITITYKDGTMMQQPLMDKAIIHTDIEGHMKRKPQKQSKTVKAYDTDLADDMIADELSDGSDQDQAVHD